MIALSLPSILLSDLLSKVGRELVGVRAGSLDFGIKASMLNRGSVLLGLETLTVIGNSIKSLIAGTRGKFSRMKW